MYEPFSYVMSEAIASGVYQEFMDSSPLTKLILLATVQGDTELEIAETFKVNRQKINRIMEEFRKGIR